MHRGMRARPCRLGHALAVVALCGLLVSVAKAQQFPGPAHPIAAQPSDITWAKLNSAFTVNLGAQRQSYTENDPSGLTTDGTLDTERGLAATQSRHGTDKPNEIDQHLAQNQIPTLNL